MHKTDIADETRDFPLHSSPHTRLQKCADRVLIRPDPTKLLCPDPCMASPGGGTLNVEVIGMLVGIFFGKP